MENKFELVIITRQFPFGDNETFLESEIPILSKSFSKITIYPSTKDSKIREIPKNVFVNEMICEDYQNIFKWIFPIILSFHTYKVLFKYISKIKSLNQLKLLLKYCSSFKIYSKKALQISKQHNCIIYSYWYNAFVDAYCLNKQISNHKIITRVHRGDLYEEHNSLGFFPFRDESILKILKIFSISKNGEIYLKTKYPNVKITTSRLGVIEQKEITSCSNSDNVVFVSVSNIIPVKNLDLISKTIIIFCTENLNKLVTWNHFGDGILKNEIITFLKSKNLNNLSVVFHGRLENYKILEFYKYNPVDVFINLSYSEGIPVSIMEALSFGIPVIATDVGGVNEIVNKLNGRLVSPFDSPSKISNIYKTIILNNLDRSIIQSNWKRNYWSEINFSQYANEIIELS